jgi:hypothetical protein
MWLFYLREGKRRNEKGRGERREERRRREEDRTNYMENERIRSENLEVIETKEREEVL